MQTMNVIPFQPVTLSALNVYSLRAFHPDPERGTLFGPSMETSDLNLPSRPVIDGEAASDLRLFSVLAVGEAREYWGLCSRQGLERPYALPRLDPRGTPWFFEKYQTGDDGLSHGRAVFYTPDPVRRVELDLRTPLCQRYSFSIESPAARFTQAILVNENDDSVFTDYFSAEIRAVPFERAWKLALGLSTALYASPQYDADTELGALRFRQGGLGLWTEVPRLRGRFRTPVFHRASHGELSFASTLSVFGGSETALRPPVVSLRLRPATLTAWNLDVTLHRPSQRASRLMPLAPRLRQLLWDPIFDAIFTKRRA
ncbi:MAG TPA: hypothetical protein VLJ37_11575 [bacterium]|nr:hypothetical protein [bacterium]